MVSSNLSERSEKMVAGKTPKQAFLLGYMYAKADELSKTELFEKNSSDEVFGMLVKEDFVNIGKQKGCLT